MISISIHTPKFLSLFKYDFRRRHTEYRCFSVSCSMSRKTEKRELSIQPLKSSIAINKPELDDLRFDRLQVPEKELILEEKLEFAQFVAREAVIDEEFWTAAWLRAESHWEDGMSDRFIDSHKRKFAEQEFHAIKRRCVSLQGQNSKCIVTVKKEDKIVKRSALKSVVGTLDLNLRFLMQGETFPGERVKVPMFCSFENRSRSRYGYVANLCVSKSARRQGIASNMLSFAIALAKSNGIDDVYVHVHRNNRGAQELYRKLGFEMVERATALLSDEQTYLLCCKEPLH